MTQRAKMEILAEDEDGTEGRLHCPCGEEFEFSIFTEENISINDDDAMQVKCPGCGCWAAPKNLKPVDLSAEERLRQIIGAKDRERAEATRRLMRRQ